MSTMSRRKTSYLWEYFSIIDPSNRIAQCDICDRKLRYQSTATNLRKHLDRKHPTILAVHGESEAVVVDALSDVCDYEEVVDGQDNQQPVYSTQIIDYESHEPVSYSLKIEKIETTKGATNGDESSGSVFVVTDNSATPSVSTSPAVVPSDATNGDEASASLFVVGDNGTTPSAPTSPAVVPSGAANGDEGSASLFVVTDNRVTPSVSTSPAVAPSIGTVKRKWQEPKGDRLMVQHKQLSSSLKENDEFDLLGMSIAVKMRKMSRTNNVQCIIAEKLISEVLYHGQLQFLTFNTVIKVSDKHN